MKQILEMILADILHCTLDFSTLDILCITTDTIIVQGPVVKSAVSLVADHGLRVSVISRPRQSQGLLYTYCCYRLIH